MLLDYHYLYLEFHVEKEATKNDMEPTILTRPDSLHTAF